MAGALLWSGAASDASDASLGLGLMATTLSRDLLAEASARGSAKVGKAAL